jgi:hypothetical protein
MAMVALVVIVNDAFARAYLPDRPPPHKLQCSNVLHGHLGSGLSGCSV